MLLDLAKRQFLSRGTAAFSGDVSLERGKLALRTSCLRLHLIVRFRPLTRSP